MASIQPTDDGSQLFLVRLWTDHDREAEALAGNRQPAHTRTAPVRCHGKVQHVMSGTAARFDDWPALMDLLMNMVPHGRRSR